MCFIRTAKVVAAAAALALMASCTAGGTSGDTHSEIKDATGEAVTIPETYKLGLAVPLTGAAASYGEEYRLATELGIAAANEEFADEGITLELVVEDSQATAEGGVNAMNILGAVKKAPVVLTAWSTVVLAGAPVAEDLGFALINAGAQSPIMIGASPNIVNYLPMNDVQLSNFTKYVTEELGHKKFATIYVDNENGQTTASDFKKAVEELGGTVVAEESIRQDATDAATQIAKVKDSGADFVYVQTLLVEGAAVMKAAREANLGVPFGSYAGVGESRIIRDAGQDTMNGLLYMSHIPEDIDGVNALLAEMLAVKPNIKLANQSYNSYFYTAPSLYAEAIKRLRAEGAPVTGENVLAIFNTESDFTVPIVGEVDLTEDLTFRGPTLIREIQDWRADPMDDVTVDAVTAD